MDLHTNTAKNIKIRHIHLAVRAWNVQLTLLFIENNSRVSIG
jgi:hypothetical protein